MPKCPNCGEDSINVIKRPEQPQAENEWRCDQLDGGCGTRWSEG